MSKKQGRKAKSAKVEDQAVTEAATEVATCEFTGVDQPADEPKVVEETVVPVQAVEHIEVTVVLPEREHPIEHVAKQLILGIRDEWLPSIRTRAALMGIEPTSQQTVETWKKVFIAWGGQGIIKP
jgi:hypothetical protein